MKQTLLFLCVLAGASTAFAADYPSMVFELKDGSTVRVNSERLSIKFDRTNLIATHSDGTDRISLSDLSKLYFTTNAASLAEVAADLSGDVDVFTAAGVHSGHYQSAQEALNALPDGIYIIKSGDITLKIRK